MSIQKMKELAEKIAGVPEVITLQKDKVVAIVEYQSGIVIDMVYQLPQ